jgi:hypothetical protein
MPNVWDKILINAGANEIIKGEVIILQFIKRQIVIFHLREIKG